MIVRKVKNDRRLCATAIKEDLQQLDISVRTIQRRIGREDGFNTGWTTKRPYINAMNRRKQIE